jgi:hypothetical protein
MGESRTPLRPSADVHRGTPRGDFPGFGASARPLTSTDVHLFRAALSSKLSSSFEVRTCGTAEKLRLGDPGETSVRDDVPVASRHYIRVSASTSTPRVAGRAAANALPPTSSRSRVGYQRRTRHTRSWPRMRAYSRCGGTRSLMRRTVCLALRASVTPAAQIHLNNVISWNPRCRTGVCSTQPSAASQTAWATSGRQMSPWAPDGPLPSRMNLLPSRL